MKASIVTACYNKEKFIKSSFSSLLAQTHDDWEWVVVDDRSSDNSWKMLKKFRRADKRVKLVKASSRQWCAGAYAIGVAAASHPIICILDADDVLLPTAIEQITRLYEKYPEVGYIYTQHDIWNSSLRTKMKRGVSSLPDPDKSFAQMAIKNRSHCFSHWRTYRNGIIAPELLFPKGLQSCVDKYMGFVLEQTATGGFYNHVLYKYRWYSGGNITTVVNSNLRDTQRKRWIKMAHKFSRIRQKKNVHTHPVLDIE